MAKSRSRGSATRIVSRAPPRSLRMALKDYSDNEAVRSRGQNLVSTSHPPFSDLQTRASCKRCQSTPAFNEETTVSHHRDSGTRIQIFLYQVIFGTKKRKKTIPTQIPSPFSYSKSILKACTGAKKGLFCSYTWSPKPWEIKNRISGRIV